MAGMPECQHVWYDCFFFLDLEFYPDVAEFYLFIFGFIKCQILQSVIINVLVHCKL